MRRSRGPLRSRNRRNRRRKPDSGATPNPRGLLDFASGTPYTDPAFKLSVRRADGPSSAERGIFRQVAGVSLQVRAAPRPLFPPRDSLGRPVGIISTGRRLSEDTGMPTGTIARLLIDKGFGFIRDEGGIEHFFHRSSVRGAVFELLREGQRVEFTTEDSGKGPRAGEVRLIEG
jgi:CspA family cold shock protein